MSKWDKKSGVDQAKAQAAAKGVTGGAASTGPGFIKAIRDVFVRPNAQYPNKKQRGFGQNS